MMKKCADIIVDWLIGCSVVEKTEKELYSYAVYSLFLSISPLLLAIVFGIGMGCMRQSVLIILPFVIIRKFSGGYHTKHAWSCMIWSCLLLILCIILSLRVSCGWMLVFTTAGASVSLMYFSPIDNENRILSLEERIRYKKVTTILVVIFLILDLDYSRLCRESG